MLPSFDLVKTFLPEPFDPLEPGLAACPRCCAAGISGGVSSLPAPWGFPSSLLLGGGGSSPVSYFVFSFSVYSLLLHSIPSQGGVAS